MNTHNIKQMFSDYKDSVQEMNDREMKFNEAKVHCKTAYHDFTAALEASFMDAAQETDGTARSIARAVSNVEGVAISTSTVAAYGKANGGTMPNFHSTKKATINDKYVRVDSNGDPDFSHVLNHKRKVYIYK